MFILSIPYHFYPNLPPPLANVLSAFVICFLSPFFSSHISSLYYYFHSSQFSSVLGFPPTLLYTFLFSFLFFYSSTLTGTLPTADSPVCSRIFKILGDGYAKQMIVKRRGEEKEGMKGGKKIQIV